MKEQQDSVHLTEAPQLEQFVGHDGKAWPQTFDGMAWAKAFNAKFPTVPMDDALAWFANAIMRGYDEANWQRDAKHSDTPS